MLLNYLFILLIRFECRYAAVALISTLDAGSDEIPGIADNQLGYFDCLLVGNLVSGKIREVLGYLVYPGYLKKLFILITTWQLSF
jgi:hypothetical protein